ncbi:MAG TPA: protein phosphatase 2C domain-containing protein [Acidobacteriota bacterium]|nr:protein phosphatase 2C domain-containing protein [Acidobacteriota bacterium]
MSTPSPSSAVPYALQYACICDRGLRRSANQDRAWADLDHRVFAVCDGVGGSQGGEIASQTAIETLQDAFYTPDNNPPLIRLERAVYYANRDIFEMAARDVHLAGMATTIVVLYLEGKTAYIGHAGDSRIYRFFQGKLTQETEDHTEVQEAVRRGSLTPEEAVHARGKNIIMRALGIQPEIELETRSLTVEVGTRFLLCSDGITRHISNAEIEELMGRITDPQVLCDEFHRLCYSRGADDNLTALVVALNPHGDSITAPSPTPVTVDSIPSLDPVLVHSGEHSFSAELRRSREHSIPPRSFPPERGGGKSHPFEEHLAAQKAALKRRLIGLAIGVIFLVGLAFWAGQQSQTMRSPQQPDTPANLPGKSPTSPPSNQALFEAGQKAMTESNPKAAQDIFSKLVNREPTRAQYHYWLGRAALANQQPQEAGKSLEKAIELDSKLADAYLYLAAARRMTGNLTGSEAALKEFEKRHQPAPSH